MLAFDALLSDLVEISKLDGGSQKVQNREFALSEVLLPLANEFKFIAAKASVGFRYRPNHSWLNSDKTLLRRIIQNFLTNAVRYSQHDGEGEGKSSAKVLLAVRRRADKLRIEVWDSGPGMAQAQLALIFNEFERLGHGSEKPGLGLGLAICERIGNLLAAKIEVKSSLGKGSCFAIELPRISAPTVAAKAAGASVGEGLADAVPGQVVLLIDNDPLVLTALLGEWGYRVYAGADRQAVQHVLAQGKVKPDLILADYHLHDSNGVDLVQALFTAGAENAGAETRQPPCIINSADSSEAVRAHTINAGFSFIGKPVKALALKRLMRRLLG